MTRTNASRRIRANGEGSLYREKTGRWVYAVHMPDGKRRKVTAPTEAECLRKAQTLQVRAGKPIVTDGTLTVSDLLDRLLIELEQDDAARNTLKNYRGLADRYLRPSIGGLPAAGLPFATCSDLIRGLRQPNGEPLGIGSKRACKTVLSMAYRRAHLEDPTTGMVLTSKRQLKRSRRATVDDGRIFTPDEIRTLLASPELAASQWRVLFTLLALTGMRIGEALGLQYGDIDLKAGTIRIERNLSYVDRVAALGDPKSEKGFRTLQVGPAVVEALRSLPSGIGTAQLFPGPHNGFTIPATPATAFARLCGQLRIEEGKRHPHALRHGVVTALLDSGMPAEAVAQYVGHEDPAYLARVYAGHLKVQTAACADALSELAQ
ncbi:MAG: tyrosine-type recombinase/integrase [Acidimicrobiales bacterium]|jgi:integrase